MQSFQLVEKDNLRIHVFAIYRGIYFSYLKRTGTSKQTSKPGLVNSTCIETVCSVRATFS